MSQQTGVDNAGRGFRLLPRSFFPCENFLRRETLWQSKKNGGKNRKALIGIVAAVAAVVILVVVLLCVFVECEPAHTHTYGEWTTVKAATCEETGERERACPCGEKQTEAMRRAGIVAPRCTVFGMVSGMTEKLLKAAKER